MKSKIRVFGRNKDGKIEFTSEELEELLNEVYTDGYNDGITIHGHRQLLMEVK